MCKRAFVKNEYAKYREVALTLRFKGARLSKGFLTQAGLGRSVLWRLGKGSSDKRC